MAVLPLTGFVVGVTADRRADEQIELLRRRGAATLHGPTIKTLPLDADQALRSRTDDMLANPPDFVIANTGIGMRAWFMAAENWGIGDRLLDALSGAQVFARGPKASAAAHAAGLEVAWRAPSERLDEVVDLLLAEPLAGKRVAYQEHGAEPGDVLARLTDAGAIVIRIPVYRWIVPDDTTAAERLLDAIVNRRVHAVTFTSAPAVRNLFALAESLGLDEPLRSALQGPVIVASVGLVCSGELSDAGVSDVVMPAKPRLGLLVRSLSHELARTLRRITVGDHVVRVQGSALFVDDSHLILSEREAAVLTQFVERPGVVISKASLLQTVWAGNNDEHVVEVTVSRLRSRLGAVGSALRTVQRRGYVLDATASDGELHESA